MPILKPSERVAAVDAFNAMGKPLWHFAGGAMFRYLVSTGNAKGTFLRCEKINRFTQTDSILVSILQKQQSVGPSGNICEIFWMLAPLKMAGL